MSYLILAQRRFQILSNFNLLSVGFPPLLYLPWGGGGGAGGGGGGGGVMNLATMSDFLKTNWLITTHYYYSFRKYIHTPVWLVN